MHVVVTAGAVGEIAQAIGCPSGASGADPAVALVAELTACMAGADLVIAADGGADLVMAAGRLPDVLVGDLDSISPAVLAACVEAAVSVHQLPAAKDESDGEYALRLAAERGATRITVVGALGGPRLDHLLVNVFLLTAPWLAGCDVRLVDARYEVFLARGDAHLWGTPGDVVSLLPLTPAVATVQTEGLVYPLCGESLVMGSSRGLSNVLHGSAAHVQHGEGLLLVVHDRGPERHAGTGFGERA